MKQSNSLITVEKNNKSNISINVGVLDELSCDNIRRNYNEVSMLENEFTDRLEYSKDVLTKKLLPKQLQSDFNIVPRLSNGTLEYETKAITLDAYEKFPMKTTFTMQFKDVEEARKFRENGIENLQKQANLLQHPVEIPNITNIKDFIGDFENPVAYSTKHGPEGIKLFICPKPLPPAQKYSIEIFNQNMSFKVISFLRLLKYDNNEVVLTNKESIDEPFDVTIKFLNIKQIEEEEQYQGKFNITISLREKYYNNCEINKEMMKYKFLVEDANNHILIDNIDENANIFSFENCGKITYRKSDYKKFDRIINLIDKVIYISKLKDIKVDFDIDYFMQKEDFINLIYNEMNNRNYKIKKSMTCCLLLDKKEDIDELYKKNGKLCFCSTLDNVELFGTTIHLKNNKLIMYSCTILDCTNKGKNKELKLESSNIEFKIVSKK